IPRLEATRPLQYGNRLREARLAMCIEPLLEETLELGGLRIRRAGMQTLRAACHAHGNQHENPDADSIFFTTIQRHSLPSMTSSRPNQLAPMPLPHRHDQPLILKRLPAIASAAPHRESLESKNSIAPVAL